MKFLLRHRGLIIAILVVALILAMAVASLMSRGTTPVSNALGVLFKPLQVFMSGVVGMIEGSYDARYAYDSLLAENEQLRVQVAEYERQSRAYQEAMAENEQLRELLDVRAHRPKLQFEMAKIITRDSSNWARTFTIDQGANAGIEVGDCVVTSELYLAGVVREVGSNWATLVSVIDTDLQIGARVFRTDLTAVAEGSFELMQEGKLALSYLPVDADIQNGDEILTSGAGGTYPKDIPIGRVIGMETEASGISARAILEPLAELDRLTKVFVVTDFSGEVEP